MGNLKKINLVLLLSIALSTLCFSQTTPTELTPDTRFYNAVDKWVAFPDNEKANTFYYGFIYLDQEAGFTFDFGGTFTVDNSGKYAPANVDSTRSTKFRIEPNWRLVAVFPDENLADLNLPKQPNWLPAYKEGSGTVPFLVNTGYHFNHVGASNLAFPYLTQAYAKDPHYKGLEFELAYAYNATEQYERAIPVLEKAIAHDPSNFYFFRELGFAYRYLGQIEKAEETYRKGIKLSNNNFEKSEMAVNMAQAYFQLRNRPKFNEWAKLTKKYAEKNSKYTKFIQLFEKEWNNPTQ